MANSRTSSAQTDDPIRQDLVVVVDDDPMLREAFLSVLEGAGFHVETYGSAEQLLATKWAGRADCVLLDVGLPGITGLDLLQRLSNKEDRVPVVMITGSGDVRTAVQAMKAGAADFIEKPASETEIVATIKRAIGQKKGRLDLDTLQLDATRFNASLTPRQREILQRVVDGQPNKIIAADLGINQRTVENHRAAIMRKSGVKSLPALARMVFASSLSSQSLPTGLRPQADRAPFIDTRAPGEPGESESDRFERYFDQIPLAVVVSAIATPERIIYANPAFEHLSGRSRADVEGQPWSCIRGVSVGAESTTTFDAAVLTSSDLIGTFQIDLPDSSSAMVEVFSNVIDDDDDGLTFRLIAMVDIGARDSEKLREFELLIREKDTRLLEIQHRVKNNLQMITALVRIEARKAQGRLETLPFDRLAGRISSIQLVYKLLSESGQGDDIDLGVYLSEIASSIMHSSAVEGVRLDLKVDSYRVSVNVALPTGMVVNELLTNALKHAFVDREGGTITLHSLTNAQGCRVVVADDGVGLPPKISWPQRGKLSALILQSLRQNAKADIVVESKLGEGTRVTINFLRDAESRAASPAVNLLASRDPHEAVD